MNPCQSPYQNPAGVASNRIFPGAQETIKTNKIRSRGNQRESLVFFIGEIFVLDLNFGSSYIKLWIACSFLHSRHRPI